MKKLAIIPGEGIGPEISLRGINLLQTLREYHAVEVEGVLFDLHSEHYIKDTESFSRSLAKELDKNYDAILFGAIGSARSNRPASSRDLYNYLKKELDLYLFFSRLNPLLIPEGNSYREKLSAPLVLLRENQEGQLRFIHRIEAAGGEELENRSLIYSRSEARRIIRYAFEYALKYKYPSIHLIDDPSFGGRQTLFQSEFSRISGEYEKSAIKTFSLSLHAGIVEMLIHPERIKVIVSSGYAGGLLAHLFMALQGGWGMGCFGAVNPGRLSIFAPLHGVQSGLKGKGIANPLAFFIAISLALGSMGLYKAAKWIEDGIIHAMENRWVTPDLGGSFGTDEVSGYICNYISTISENKE